MGTWLGCLWRSGDGCFSKIGCLVAFNFTPLYNTSLLLFLWTPLSILKLKEGVGICIKSTRRMAEEKVILHVYDLSNGLAKKLSGSLLGTQVDGIWHTGVVVAGIEYYFGSGVQQAPAGRTHFGRPLQVIEIGVTEVPSEIREELIGDLMTQFTAETYDLLSNNCNNFSNELCNLLTGKGIPEHIVSLPDNLMSTPFGQVMKPLLMQMEGQLGNVREGESSTPSIPPVNRTPVPAQPKVTAQPTKLSMEEKKAAFERAVRKEFDILREQGVVSNEAASRALMKAKEQFM